MLNETYGQRMKQQRIRLGLKQKDLASMVGMSPTHLSHIETGKRDPSMRNAAKISNVLGEDFFLTGDKPGSVVDKLFDALTDVDKRLVMDLLIRLQCE